MNDPATTVPAAIIEDLGGLDPVVADLDGAPRVLARACRACGQVTLSKRTVCYRCLASDWDDTWLAAVGTLYAFTRVHVSSTREVPYTIGYVDLDAGLRILAGIQDFESAEVNQRVSLVNDGGWVYGPLNESSAA